MTELSVEEARRIVDDIRVTNGGLSPEAEQGLSEETRRALRNLQLIAGGSIVHVAQDLYDKDTRFIYELIQNAEDNRYIHATRHQKEPFLHFTLHQDRITVDSNEDGFSENDVQAICSIHRSSKKQTSGYIGHKGIGFKSVFKIACKVTIQSGPFCFFFTYRQGESGMGMITPNNNVHEALPAAVRTRITLHLISPTDFDARAREFNEIPETLLLFLRKLRMLSLEIVPHSSKTSHERLEESSGHRVTLIKQTNGQQHRKSYLFERSTLSNLPEHSSRPGGKGAELILAFPIDDESHPLIEPQYVYSFVPMRHEGFNFLIQSDFITQANRLGVHLCPRNYAIRQGICDLFVQAILNLSKDPQLKYRWLQYLPGPHIHDPFWFELREMIFDSLKESKVLLTRRGTVKYARNLQHLSSRHCDSHGLPLVEDLESEIYLSPSYNWSRDADSLMELGVTNLSYARFLDRLEPYLIGLSPRLLHTSLDADWHTRVANLLLRALKQGGRSSTITERIRKLPLVPTVRHQLVSPRSHFVYFPVDQKGHSIPDDLTDLQIVRSSVLESPPRRELIEALGVEHCRPDMVVKSILKRYNHHDGVTISNSVSHLSYLFRTMGAEDTLDKRIFIMDESAQRIYRVFVTLGVDIITDDLYFETMGEYGTRALGKLQSSSDSSGDTPRYDLHIIHRAYIEAVPVETIVNGRTWEQWLEEVAHVRRVPRLKNGKRDDISPLGRHLADHYPMTMLGVLKTYTIAYKHEMTRGVIKALSLMRVRCRNNATNELLESTYFPSQELTQLCSSATVNTTFNLFLDIPPALLTNDIDGWGFLATLGVCLKPSIQFFWDLFAFLRDKNSDDGHTRDAYFGVYKELFLRFPNKDELLEGIFSMLDTVYVPARSDRPATVIHFFDCIWNGHPCLQTAFPLAIYTEYKDNPYAVGLFKSVLHLPDADLQRYLDELQWRKDRPNVSKDDLAEIYRIISEQITSPEDHALVLDEFNKHSLLFLRAEQKWVAPSSCVWTDAAKIGRKYGIKAEYPDLRAFFCDMLSIPVPNAANYIEQLSSLVSCHPVNLANVKESIGHLNALRPKTDEVQALRELRFVPVRMPDNSIQLLRATDTFFIPDRVEYLSSFRGKVPILDFSLKECRRHRQLLGSLSLDDRYMSAAVQERTFVDQPSHEPSSRLTREFRRRAGAIYRCILHYNGDEPVDTLRKLQSSMVYESDGFRKTLLLHLDEVRVEVQSDSGLAHIDALEDRLQVYIPRTPEERKRCYSLYLPKTLQHHFEFRVSEAQLTLQLVFLAAEGLIDQLLDSYGIFDIPEGIPQPPDFGSDNGVNSQGEAEGNQLNAGESGTEQSSETDTQINRPLSSPSLDGRLALQERLIVSRHSAVLPPPRPLPLVQYGQTPEPVVPEQSPYARLLENVITIARQHTLYGLLEGPPNNHATGIANIAHEDAFGSRAQRQLDHDIKIGAAGELFVFELLDAELPMFDRTNWRSTIRKHVSVHPEYHNMAPWSGVETADIVYGDTCSFLTYILVGAGHLSQDWVGANPTYYIEVKTTTGECDSAFFMSRAQYRRMERMQLQHVDQQPNPEIYVIFRVHHLGKENMGLQVYVDPESLRQEGRLVFHPESYSVRPGRDYEG